MKIIFFLNLRVQQMKTGGYLHRVQVDVAECAYKLKWNNHIEGSKCDSSDNPRTDATNPPTESEPECRDKSDEQVHSGYI